MGRRTRVVEPAGGVRTFAYDAAGRTSLFQDPTGRRVTFQRDAAGRKTTQIGASATTTWGYDSSDRLQYLRSGSLTRFTYSYDNNSNLKTVEDLMVFAGCQRLLFQ